MLDILERTYAGVLGKIIGVYLGRPFEGWTHERIMAELGEIHDYVHDHFGLPLVVTDDDISGTFTFLRALADYHYRPDLTPAQIGQTWLNYIIDGRTILWWGGLGNSTEHTAYLRLKNGIVPPESGSIVRNGKVVAEQIGAQIFIDGWGMICPGNPEQAADFARRAASVSHDGEAIYGAQVIAAMEAQAYVESDIQRLIETAVTFIPHESVIYRMIQDIRGWHHQESDWHATRQKIEAEYGYAKYGGNCHIVPNHGLIMLSLLYGDDDFQKSLMIVNTSGWDTDCNSANVGCLLGIKNGLAGIDSSMVDWRGPIADRLYLPTADGGRAISDAVTETYHVVNSGRTLRQQEMWRPKGGARFHFELPGAVQGFMPDGCARLENSEGHSQDGQRSLAIRYSCPAPPSAATATFIPPEAINMPGYQLLASPTLYSGQTVKARLSADSHNTALINCGLYIQVYTAGDQLRSIQGPEICLTAGMIHTFEWVIPDTGGQPIVFIGVQITSDLQTDGSVYLDYLTWDGTPTVQFMRPADGGTMWRRAWVNGVDHFDRLWPEAFRIVQDTGTGLLIQGTREWKDYVVSSTLVPHMVEAAGIGARVQGMRRYYALLLNRRGTAQLIKELDGTHILAETPFAWEFGSPYTLSLEVSGARLRGWIDQCLLFDMQDTGTPLSEGAIALICSEGRVAAEVVSIEKV